MYVLYLFKKLLHQNAYFFTGREGMLFFDGVEEYLISTLNYVPNNRSKSNYEVVIIYNGIRLKNGSPELDEENKKSIANDVKNRLEKSKIITRIE